MFIEVMDGVDEDSIILYEPTRLMAQESYGFGVDSISLQQVNGSSLEGATHSRLISKCNAFFLFNVAIVVLFPY